MMTDDSNTETKYCYLVSDEDMSDMEVEQNNDQPKERLSSPYMVDDTFDSKIGVNSTDMITMWMATEDKFKTYTPDVRPLRKYRRLLVDWLCDTTPEFELHSNTMHVAVALMDRTLQRQKFMKHELQLVAICCYFIAAKFEETEENIPSFEELSAYTDGLYNTVQIRKMEVFLLKCLNWDISTITPLKYLGVFFFKGVVFEDDTVQGRELISKVPRYVNKYLQFFSDLCLQEYSFQKYRTSLLASAIIAASRRALYIKPLWCPELEDLTSYAATDIWECYEHIWNFYAQSFPAEVSERYIENDSHYTSPNSVMHL
jgi:hypothetical protein